MKLLRKIRTVLLCKVVLIAISIVNIITGLVAIFTVATIVIYPIDKATTERIISMIGRMYA